ncbi:MAG: hypothetical protein ACI9KS_002620, partial [Sulfitobacter sp.]
TRGASPVSAGIDKAKHMVAVLKNFFPIQHPIPANQH